MRESNDVSLKNVVHFVCRFELENHLLLLLRKLGMEEKARKTEKYCPLLHAS